MRDRFWTKFRIKVEVFMMSADLFEVYIRKVTDCSRTTKHKAVGRKVLKSGPMFSSCVLQRVSRGRILVGRLGR